MRLMPHFLRPAQRAKALLKTLAPPPAPPLHRSYISDPIPSAFNENLLRILRTEITYLSDYRPPHPPPPAFRSFSVEHRPGEQWIRLRSRHAGGREDVKVDATMFDGAAPVSRRPGYDDEVRLHISLVVEVSKGEGSDSVLEFICSAWPDSLEVQKVFPLLRSAQIRPYMGQDFKDLDEKLQSAVQEYLEERGVDDELAEFLHEYMANKDKAELIRWMGNVGSYVQK